MPSPFVIEYLEIVLGSLLLAVAVLAAVTAVVGGLTYLLTRESARPAPAGGVIRVTATPATPAARARPAAEVPAVAG
jgi:hypothetical protein